MIFIVIEGQYYVNYVLTLIEVIFTCIFLYFAQSMVMTSLYDDRNQEEKRSNSSSVLISLLIALGIGLGLRYLIGLLGYFLIGIRVLDTLYLSLAIMVTVFFPFYLIILKKFNTENFYRSNKKLRKIFKIRSLFVIVASWIVFLVFLSIDLLGIPLYDLLPADPQNPFYDVFLLGFEWTIVVV